MSLLKKSSAPTAPSLSELVKPPPRTHRLSFAFNIIALFSLLITLLYTLYLRHRFVEIYEHLEVALPGLTQLLIGLPAWIPVMGTVLLIVLLLIKEQTLHGNRFCLTINALVPLGCMIYTLLYSNIFLLPILRISMEN